MRETADAGTSVRHRFGASIGLIGACLFLAAFFVPMATPLATSANADPVGFTFDGSVIDLGGNWHRMIDSEVPDTPATLATSISPEGMLSAEPGDFQIPESRMRNVPTGNAILPFIDAVVKITADAPIAGTFDPESGAADIAIPADFLITIHSAGSPSSIATCRIDGFTLEMSTDGVSLSDPGNPNSEPPRPAADYDAAPFGPPTDRGAISVTWPQLPQSQIVSGSLASAVCPEVDRVLGGPGGTWLAGKYGEIEVPVSTPPDNDNFDDAQVLSGDSVSVDGDVSDATLEPGEPDHYSGVSTRSVWYSWTAPESASVNLSSSGLTVVSVYTGSEIGDLTQIASNPFSANFNAEEGTTYRIAIVETSVAAAGAFTLTLQQGEPPIGGDAVGFTFDESVIDLGGNWHQMIDPGVPDPPATLAMSVTPEGTLSAGADDFQMPESRMRNVSTGNELMPLIDAVVKITADAPITGTFDPESGAADITIPADFLITIHQAGSPVSVAKCRIDGFTLELRTDAASLSDPGNPDAVPPRPAAEYGAAPFDPPTDRGAVSVNWTQLPQSQVVSGSLAGAVCPEVDRVLGGPGGTWLAGKQGEIDIPVPTPPGNDDFDDAQSLSGNSVSVEGDLSGATLEPGEPDHFFGNTTKSVWYSWTASDSGNVNLSSSGLTVVGVYTGDEIGALTHVSSDLLGANFDAEEGVTYRIAVVETSHAPAGTFTLSLGQGTPPTGGVPVSFTFDESVMDLGGNWHRMIDPGVPDPPATLTTSVSTEGALTAEAADFQVPLSRMRGVLTGNEVLPMVDIDVKITADGPITGTFDAVSGAADVAIPADVHFTVFQSGSPVSIARCRIDGFTLELSTDAATLSDPGDPDAEPPRPAADYDAAPFAEPAKTGAMTTSWSGLPTSQIDGGSLAFAVCPVVDSMLGGPGGTWLAGNVEVDPGPSGETATIDSTFSPRSGSFSNAIAKPADWHFEADVTAPYPANQWVLPLKHLRIELPADTELRLDDEITPPCPDSEVGPGADLSEPPGQVVARCPDSVIGNGAAELYIAGMNQSNGPALKDGILVLFNGGTNTSGERIVKLYGHSTGTNAGMYVEGLWRDGKLDLPVPVLSANSGIGSLTLDIPGTQHVNASLRGQDLGVVQARCSTGNLLTHGQFTLGTRDIEGSPTSPDKVLEAESNSGCVGAPPQPQTLTVAKSGEGSGTITSVPDGIDCGDDCQASFPESSEVTLTATPDSDSAFAGWTGACSGTSACEITMYEAKSVTANFADVTPPDTAIDSGPSGTITTNQATFTFSGTSGDTAKIQCKLDTGAFEDCTSPKTFSNLSQGAHTVSFRAEDAVGNQDQTPATRTFTVDTVAPTLAITSGPSGVSNEPGTAFVFGSEEAGVTFGCQLDGSGFQSCSSPKTFEALSAGSHTFQVRVTDSAGNTSEPQTRTWTYNPSSQSNTTSGTVAPGEVVSTDPTNSGPTEEKPATASITVPNNGTVQIIQEPSSASPPSGFSVVGQQFRITAPSATVAEPLVLTFRLDASALPSGVAIGQLTLLRNDVPAGDCTGPSGTATPDPCVSSREQLPDGDVVLTVLSSHASDWNVVIADAPTPPDTTPPDTTINSGPSGTITTNQATFTFSGTSGDTAKIQCKLDTGAFEDCTSPKTFTDLTDGTHTFSFRAEDTAANKDETPATRTITVDVRVNNPHCQRAEKNLGVVKTRLGKAKKKLKAAKKGLAKAKKARKKSKVKRAKTNVAKAKRKVRAAEKSVSKAKSLVRKQCDRP